MSGLNILSEDVRKLVLARLEVLPDNVGIAVGTDGDYSKEQLLKHINDGDEIGKQFIDLDLAFLRALKEGSLFEQQDATSH